MEAARDRRKETPGEIVGTGHVGGGQRGFVQRELQEESTQRFLLTPASSPAARRRPRRAASAKTPLQLRHPSGQPLVGHREFGRPGFRRLGPRLCDRRLPLEQSDQREEILARRRLQSGRHDHGSCRTQPAPVTSSGDGHTADLLNAYEPGAIPEIEENTPSGVRPGHCRAPPRHGARDICSVRRAPGSQRSRPW